MAVRVEDVVRLAVAALSLLVFIVGVVAYLRRPTTRMLLVVLLFTAFLVQGILLLIEVLFLDSPVIESIYYAFQLLEIALVATIILKR